MDTIAPEQYDRYRVVKEKVEADFLSRPGVLGVGVGEKTTGGFDTGVLAIVVFVEKKGLASGGEPLPRMIDDIPTDVVQSRAEAPASLVPSKIDEKRYDPLLGGCMISATTGANTFSATGGVILYIGGNHYVLTAGHFNREFKEGFDCYQPKTTSSNNVIGNGYKWICENVAYDGTSKYADGALIRCDAKARNYTLLSIVDIGKIEGAVEVNNDLVGAKCWKRGAFSGLTTGTIKALDSSYNGRKNCIVVKPEFSLAGDSGAVVIVRDKDDKNYVAGLIQGGVPKTDQLDLVSPIDIIDKTLGLNLNFYKIVPKR